MAGKGPYAGDTTESSGADHAKLVGEHLAAAAGDSDFGTRPLPLTSLGRCPHCDGRLEVADARGADPLQA